MMLGWRSIRFIVVVTRRRVRLELEHRHERGPLLCPDARRSCRWADQTHLRQ